MKILGIETSCDETAVCIIETKESDKGTVLTVLGNQLYSQIELHKQYGGVFPMMAKREHAKNLVPLLKKCLEEAGHNRPVHQNIHPALTKAGKAEPPLLFPSLDKEGLGAVEETIKKILEREGELYNELEVLLGKVERPEIDAIAVTNGPGLEPALWVGVTFAKALSTAWNIPVIPSNHMEGHIFAATLQKYDELKVQSDKVIKSDSHLKPITYQLTPVTYPAIALLISGGHTQLVLANDNLKYEIIGGTRDDAVGEAYDKVARMLGLPYPGGPQISKYADAWKEKNISVQTFKFPRPMIHSKDLNFSFSGLKTSVLYTIKEIPELTEEMKQEISFEFQNAVIDVLIAKTKTALIQYSAKTLIVGGGVIANKDIRLALENLAAETGVDFKLPEISASTDNALMIAVAGFMNIQAGKKFSADFTAKGNLSL